MFRALRPLLAALALMLAAAPVRAEDLRVVTTILPFHGIAAAVMQGAGAPRLLMGPGASPHTYSLRPSDAETLSGAQLVIWGGPDLEVSLATPIDELASRARILELDKIDGLTLLAYRPGTIWRDGDGGGHDHDHHGTNMHFWLDPHNAAVIATAIAEALTEIDPDNATIYRENTTRFANEMKQLDVAIDADLAAVRGKRYVVFHDAFQYFEHRFGFPAAATIALSPESPPGARHVSEIHALLKEGDIVCVFAEPQFTPRLIATLIEGTEVRSGMLDPLGVDIPQGPGFYPALIRKLSRSLHDCLAG